MAYGEYVTLPGVEIGDDSETGLAFKCRIDDEWLWVPYSQVRARHRNRAVVGADSIEVTRWWCDQNEIQAD